MWLTGRHAVVGMLSLLALRLRSKARTSRASDAADSRFPYFIGPAENGLEVEIVGEIAKMVELSIGNKAKRATLDETMTRSVKVVAGARSHLYRTRVHYERDAQK